MIICTEENIRRYMRSVLLIKIRCFRSVATKEGNSSKPLLLLCLIFSESNVDWSKKDWAKAAAADEPNTTYKGFQFLQKIGVAFIRNKDF